MGTMLETNEAFSRYLIPDIAQAEFIYGAAEEMIKTSEKVIDLGERKKGRGGR